MSQHSQLERVEFLRRGLATKRFHTVPGESETVGHHSAGVALLITILHPDPSAALLKAALMHDLSEWVLGDVPAQVKWCHSAIASAWEALEREVDTEWMLSQELSAFEQLWLKWCDTLDLMLFARDQMRLGNSYYQLVYERGADRFVNARGAEQALPVIKEFFWALNKEMLAEFKEPGADNMYRSNPRSNYGDK